MQHTKRTMRKPESFVGKRINPTKWNLPDGYALCAMTGKFHPESALGITFAHWVFQKPFLVEHHIYIEDADWLSEEGYDQIMAVLAALGVDAQYREAAANNQQNAIPAPPTPPAPEPDSTLPEWMGEVTVAAPSARDLYRAAFRAHRQSKSRLRGDRLTADRHLNGIAAAHPSIAAAAAKSFALRSTDAGDRAMALAMTRTQRAITGGSRYLDDMVRGRELQANDTVRFSADPATWFTLTRIERGIGGAYRYMGARADGTTVTGQVDSSRRMPVRRAKSARTPIAENVLPFFDKMNASTLAEVCRA